MVVMDGAPQDPSVTRRRWRRRLWGFDPRAVETWAGEVWQLYLREAAAVVADRDELRGRLASSEAAAQEAARRAEAAEARAAQLAAEPEEQERRYRAMRVEALAAVEDAQARATEIEARSKQQVEQEAARWRDEEVRLQRDRARLREEWQAALTELRGRQVLAIDGAEALARDLLVFAESLRARVPGQPAPDGAPDATILPLAYYWHDAPGTSSPPAEEEETPGPTAGDPDEPEASDTPSPPRTC